MPLFAARYRLESSAGRCSTSPALPGQAGPGRCNSLVLRAGEELERCPGGEDMKGEQWSAGSLWLSPPQTVWG